MNVHEARLEEREAGVTPVTEGWFVLNVRDGPWLTNDARGDGCIFEGDEAPFPQVGFTLAVLRPGQTGGLYHREANTEDFLVLSGECVLLIEGEARRLRAWDFVHCPPNTEHGFVGAGDAPCVIFMTGARAGWPEKGIFYPRSELALRHGVGVERATASPAEAYASSPKWQPGRPASWRSLPWS